MMNGEPANSQSVIDRLTYENLLLRAQNVRLLDKLQMMSKEKGTPATIIVEVKQAATWD